MCDKPPLFACKLLFIFILYLNQNFLQTAPCDFYPRV
jgi:hypothetical protein